MVKRTPAQPKTVAEREKLRKANLRKKARRDKGIEAAVKELQGTPISRKSSPLIGATKVRALIVKKGARKDLDWCTRLSFLHVFV